MLEFLSQNGINTPEGKGAVLMGAKPIFHKGKHKVQINLDGQSRIISKIRDFIRNPEYPDQLVANILSELINTRIALKLFKWEDYFPGDQRKYKVRLLVLEWLSQKWKPSTLYRRDLEMKKYILPVIGERDVRDLHRADFYWIKQNYGDTPKAKNIRDTIQTFLSWCYDEQTRKEYIKLPPIKPDKKDLPYISKQDRELIQRHVDPVYQPATLLSLRMGLRSNEIAVLEWDAVEFDRGGINIKRGMSHYQTTNSPKEGGSRFSPFQGEVELTLRSLYETLKESGTLPVGLVFRLESGARMWPNLISWEWTKAGREVGIQAHLHWNRHSLGQDMLEEGFSMTEVAAILGHKTIRTTEKSYARHNRGSLVKIAERRR